MARQLASKWLKTEALLRNGYIAAHIPQTAKYSPEHLKWMLERYKFVFIKPVKGGGGHGVIKVARYASGYYCTRLSQTYYCAHFEELKKVLSAIKLRRPYLIQQGIELATIQGRPIDYRIKTVKNGEQWEFRSMVGRLARPGLVITNLCKGGTLLPGREGLRRSLKGISVSAKRREMRELTRLCISVLEGQFPGVGELGFDYGLDRRGRIWILEVNTRPQ
ncbi:YheC/YheD family protein [Paenibacillus sp. P96]|uniref:YheC/YheD family protein n=1 Tax=Paenibacillus zeirhizosphaerae TaxID=2987519 RepID=A0ABT9FUQ4_9BACL|nr:YheC/YheD family protein [Paenibacillus sp. P96]MDP4098443.1 YheC/YheD family protein [Paenibacillus sp. P96]